MYKYYLFIFLLLTPNLCFADLIDVIKATVRIKRMTVAGEVNGTGSGVVFKEDKDYYYVLTAGHVAYHNDYLHLEFFVDGKKSDYILGKVLKSYYTEEDIYGDLALVRVAKDDMPYIVPIVPLSEIMPKHGDIVVTCGCPDATWPTLFRGTLNGADTQHVNVTPPVKKGRSGSGLFNRKGTGILGIVVRSDGGCVPLTRIRKFLE